MVIELKWSDENTSKKHSTEIYRSNVVFQDIDEAIKIAVVGPGVTTYIDADVIQGMTYYYKFRNILGKSKSPVSRVFEFKAGRYTGPGPSTIDFGDENFGYYGSIPTDTASVPSIDDARAMLGLGPIQHTLSSTNLHKFAVGGTIRTTFQYPVSAGFELPRDNPALATLLSGSSIHITKGIHSWAMILPSANLINTGPPDTIKYPGELRSMLGVITDLYSRVEDAQYGNQTGHKLTESSGGINFYTALDDMYYGFELSYLATIDWLSTSQCNVIYWTPAQTLYPLRPKELHIKEVDYSIHGEWDLTLIWPVFIYLGLAGE